MTHVTCDPKVRGGEGCIRGTRVPVHVLVVRRLYGESVEEIAGDYNLNPDVVKAALKWAADRIPSLREWR